MPHSDIRAGDWVDRFLPPACRPYARLMRLDRPIGTWLLLWPCLWGAALASDGALSGRLVVLFALGAFVMRGAGCVINDLWDRHLDRKVERTQTRPLASGALTLFQAFSFLAVLLLIGLAILLQFSPFAILVGLASVPLFVLYPLAKRVTFWPQFILGLAFNWGVLVAFAEQRGGLTAQAFGLYAAGVCWTLAYDTIYAVQDRRDDVSAGVKSTALLFGSRVRLWVAGFFDAMMILLLICGYSAGLGGGFYALMVLAYGHACWQALGWHTDDPQNCLMRFRSNRDLGFIVFLALWAGSVT